MDGSEGVADFTMALTQMEKLKDDDEPRAETLGHTHTHIHIHTHTHVHTRTHTHTHARRDLDPLQHPPPLLGSQCLGFCMYGCAEDPSFVVLDPLWEAKI